jgi:hypothetical protein
MLEREQEELFIQFVKAARATPRGEARRFRMIATLGGTFVQQAGLPGGQIDVYDHDVHTLGRRGFLEIRYASGVSSFDVTPEGFAYHDERIEAAGQPIERTELEMRTFLDSQWFRTSYPEAYDRWSGAEKFLQTDDTPSAMTAIGHLTREALQKSAEELGKQTGVDLAHIESTKTIARLKEIVERKAERLGSTERPFLDALIAYWGTVSDLDQRQEHGASREGEELGSEDARRAVFGTLAVMYEVARAIDRASRAI